MESTAAGIGGNASRAGKVTMPALGTWSVRCLGPLQRAPACYSEFTESLSQAGCEDCGLHGLGQVLIWSNVLLEL